MIKFKTNYSRDKIEKVEVLRETDAFVFLPAVAGFGRKKPERREAKHSEFGHYFDSWAEARDFLLRAAEDGVIAARRSLQFAQDKFGNIKGMKEPTNAA